VSDISEVNNMPIGEDECDLDYSSSQSGMSKAEQRKVCLVFGYFGRRALIGT